MDNHMKRVGEFNSEAFAAVEASVNLATQLLHSNGTNKVDLNEMLRLCESLKTAIQARLVRLAN
jgi:hypothetical protein